MSTETMVVYWIGEEPTPPSPTLQAMPVYVDVVPLAFVTIDKNYKLDFAFLCKTHPATVIATWIRMVRANGTKVLLSINDQKLATVPDVAAFVDEVAGAALQWGVDGIDLDFEPPYESQTLLQVTSALRPALSWTFFREVGCSSFPSTCAAGMPSSGASFAAAVALSSRGYPAIGLICVGSATTVNVSRVIASGCARPAP